MSTITCAQPKPIFQEVTTLSTLSTNQTQYLICKLQEEAAEVIQAVSKINRFGEQNRHPDRATTNKQELVQELEDFLAILAVLEQTQWIDLTLSQSNIYDKAIGLMKST
jgi:NTP pyrophosphatase (non-canonical NTP hydrolase)